MRGSRLVRDEPQSSCGFEDMDISSDVERETSPNSKTTMEIVWLTLTMAGNSFNWLGAASHTSPCVHSATRWTVPNHTLLSDILTLSHLRIAGPQASAIPGYSVFKIRT